METDRHAPDGDDRIDGSAPTPPEEPTAPAGTTPPGAPTAEDRPTPDAGGSSHDYGYGDAPLAAAGADGLRAADSGTETGVSAASGDSSATGDRSAPGDPTAPEGSPATDVRSATGVRGTTALRGATAPRAVLRPVPEGFPTPPPRPARPNRRPAPKLEADGAPKRPSGLLLAGIAIAAVLLLVVVVGGGILAVRAFTSSGPDAPAAQESEAPEEQAGPGELQLTEVTLTEVSTEVGVRSVGTAQNGVEPEGEFVIVTFEVDNQSSTGVSMMENLTLESADGTHPVNVEATGQYQPDDSSGATVVPPDSTKTVHAVFDVPIGTEPTGLHIELNTLGENGTLPLGT